MKMAEQVTAADSSAMQIQIMVMVLWRRGAAEHKHTQSEAKVCQGDLVDDFLFSSSLNA